FRYSTDKDSAQYSDKRMSVIRKDYDTIHRSLFKKHEFYLKTDNNVKATEMFLSKPEFDRHRTDKRYKIEELKEATFNQELIKIIQEEIEFFQIKEVEETTTILDQIDRYNEKAERNKENYIKLNGKEKYQKLTHTQKRNKDLSKISKTRLKPIIDRLEKKQDL